MIPASVLRALFVVVSVGGAAAVVVPWFLFVVSQPFAGRTLATALFSAMIVEKLWTSFLRMPKKAAVRPDKDWTAAAVGLSYAAVVYACLVELYQRRSGFPSVPVSVAGGVLYVSGLLLRASALRRLGEQWSIQLDRADATNARLVRSGPYRWIRHPVYLAAMLEALGFAAVFASVAGFVAAVLLFCPAEIARARFEERYLRLTFGSDYDAYAAEVGGFVPRLR